VSIVCCIVPDQLIEHSLVGDTSFERCSSGITRERVGPLDVGDLGRAVAAPHCAGCGCSESEREHAERRAEI
jgi:hypothetical protein